MLNVKEKAQKSFETLKGIFGYKNALQAPRLTKVVISVGTGGAVKKDKNKNDFISGRLARISGQKPALRQAKKSISSFKIRQGDPIGVSVTLRGPRMYQFLDKLFSIALPRTKDFRGIDRKIVDDIGNVTIPIKEHTIFPETSDEELKDVFSLAVTIVSTAKTKEEGTKFYELIGVPFK